METSSPQPDTHMGDTARAPRTLRWLAIVSALCSLLPGVVWGLAFSVFNQVVFPPATPPDYNNPTGIDAQNAHAVLLVGLISLIASICAMVTGRIAQNSAKRDQTPLVWQGLAEFGRVFGILDIVALVVVVPCSIVNYALNNYHGG